MTKIVVTFFRFYDLTHMISMIKIKKVSEYETLNK